jgi:hypothetical protein
MCQSNKCVHKWTIDCFFSCQPLVDEVKMKAALKNCLKEVKWKQEAGDACECAVKAGVK